MNHFENHHFIEETLKNIKKFTKDEIEQNKCEYNLFHMEENKRQLFWYEDFGNLGYISNSGEVYLIPRATGDRYSMYHVPYDEQTGYLYTARVIDNVAGGELVYTEGIPTDGIDEICNSMADDFEDDAERFEDNIKYVKGYGYQKWYYEELVDSILDIVSTIKFNKDFYYEEVIKDKKIIEIINFILKK